MILALIFLLIGCRKESQDHEPEIYDPTFYELSIPKGFPFMVIPEDNPTTVEGIQLGRMLYYDPIIDIGNERACGQCHLQQSSFACEDNCLPHINLAWNNTFLWKGDVEGVLENIMLFEVEKFFKTDLNVINSDSIYSNLFKRAFNADTITSKEIAFALSQFVRTLSSYNSKWDSVLRGETSLNHAEEIGRELFFSEKGDCFHCHGTILLSDNSFHNNGLDSLPDLGRSEITSNEKDVGKFKTPTLRNIEFTAPYMHDGRFASLKEVIDFYSEGLNWSSSIDPLIKQVHQGGVHLNSEEKSNLISFLKTFSDSTLINNPDFSDPFMK